MACACGKPRPLGSENNRPSSNGGGLSGQTQQFTLRRDDGSTASFGSMLEAQAESVRSGGGTITFG